MADKSDDLYLPNSVIWRIIREALPERCVVGREARSALSKAASSFILYVTSTAAAHCESARRKTLSASDVLAALKDMQFGHLEPLLTEFLHTYREQTAYRKAQKRPSSTSVLEPPTSHAVVPSRLISQQNYENALVQKALNTTTSGLDDADNTVLLGPAQIDHSDYRPNSVARTNLNRSIIVDQSFEGGEESDIEVDGEIDTGLDDGGVEDEDEEVQGNTNQINKTDYLTVTKSQELSSGEFGDKPVFTDNILPARANLLSETSENAMKETNVVDDEAFDYEVPTLPVIFPVKQARVSLVTAIPSSSTPSGTVESVV